MTTAGMSSATIVARIKELTGTLQTLCYQAAINPYSLASMRVAEVRAEINTLLDSLTF